MARLAVVMIARDEAASIARALESARPHVDRMIVLDTGSTDATREIATAAGAAVYSFIWCDDFAAARNAALDRSDADWNLILDADEGIEAGGEALAALPTGGVVGEVRVDSRMAAGDGIAQAWLPRLLPRGVRYAGRIHEQPLSRSIRCSAVSTPPSRSCRSSLGPDGEDELRDPSGAAPTLRRPVVQKRRPG